jgi:AcrR family transcriptional regulator
MPQLRRSRDAAKRETREALLRAGIAEFAEHGLAGPSLDAICARAGYTRGAFYVHFRDRDELVSAIVERVLGAFLDAVIATGDEAHDLERTIGRFTAALVAIREGGPDPVLGVALPSPEGRMQLHRVLEACASSATLRSRLASLLGDAAVRVAKAAAEGQATGSVRRDADSEVLGGVLVALALGAISALEIGVPLDLERARDAVLTLLGASDEA